MASGRLISRAPMTRAGPRLAGLNARPSSIRLSSSSAQKISAIKFTVPIELARSVSSFWANVYYCGGSRWQMFLNTVFPRWVNAPSFEVIHTAPFYMPLFYIEAMMRTKVMQGRQPFDVPIKIEQGILSGFDQRPLSTLPWHNNASFDPEECEPFDERKHAYLPKSTTPVTILPYRTSPLPLLALRRQIASKGPRELSVESPTPEAENERLSFDLSKSATMYFAAYPVYVPLYLSQVKCTQSDGKVSMYTVAIIAYGSNQATSSWASRAMVFDASTEEGDRSGWHKHTSRGGANSFDSNAVTSTFGGQPVDPARFQELLNLTMSKFDTATICADPDQTWKDSPAVMNYRERAEENEDYFDAVWKTEEAKANLRSLDFMPEDVTAVKIDAHNRSISKMDRNEMKEELQGVVDHLTSEAKEARPSWFSDSPTR